MHKFWLNIRGAEGGFRKDLVVKTTSPRLHGNPWAYRRIWKAFNGLSRL